MEETLFNVRIRLAAVDYVNANRFGLLRNVPVLAGTALFTLALLVGISALTGKPFDPLQVSVIVVMVAMCYLFILPLYVRGVYRRDRRLREEIEWKIGGQGVETSSQSASDRFSWPEFEYLRVTSRYYYLKLRNPRKILKFLPKRAFAGDEARKKFEDFAKTKVKVR
jgi:hypothetical protein